MVSCHRFSCFSRVTVCINIDMSVIPARHSFDWDEVVRCLQGPFKATTIASVDFTLCLALNVSSVYFVLPALLRILQLSWMEYSRNGNINTKMQSSGCQPQSSSTLTNDTVLVAANSPKMMSVHWLMMGRCKFICSLCMQGPAYKLHQSLS